MPPKRPFRNRLNDLSTRDWLIFQKSWFIHRPPARARGALRHPGKFPESLAQEFIEFFTKPGATVLDPMVGTGSTLIGALRAQRQAVGVELNADYSLIARQEVAQERLQLPPDQAALRCEVIEADAGQVDLSRIGIVDYVLTSPPYWDMLRMRGSQTQQERRQSTELDVYYSDDPADLGNIEDYGEFLDQLVGVYQRLTAILRPGAYLTIIVKNIKKAGVLYPLAWDLARRLSSIYALKDEKIWCQDDIRLAPYGMGNAWVSNTVHHYCLQFRHGKPEKEG